MNRLITLTAAAAALICLGALLPGGIAVAQEKQRVSYKIPAENAKFTQQLFIDVGDAPGHQVRVAELRWTFPGNPPVFNGVKVAEIWVRFTSDYTDGNGLNTGYLVYVLESGDKFFAREATVSQSAGSGGPAAATVVATITGGTGKFTGIRGVIHGVTRADPKAGFNEGQWDIEYWMEK